MTPPPEITTPTPLPPLQSALWRLDRLFGGSNPSDTASASSSTAKTTTAAAPLAQSKLLKKFLGSASGTAKSVTLDDISQAATAVLDPNGVCATGRDLLVSLGATASSTPGNDTSKKYATKASREIEGYLLSLAIRTLYRQSQFGSAYNLADMALNILDAHINDCEGKLVSVGTNNSIGGVGGLYPLRSRIVRYRSLVCDSLNDGDNLEGRVNGIRVDLAKRYRDAVLVKDGDGICTVLNLMLGDLLKGDQVEQAQKLLSNATFPTESPPSNNQLLRYLYYSGRIRALRLEYTSSYSALSQCLRKCPTNTGLGFRIAVQRLCVVVQLLMGEIPDRQVFEGEGMRGEMKPYLEITRAVRKGDLAVFADTVSRHVQRFRMDGTFTLISRLEHSVVKAGLRRLKTSYSRISLEDVASRLGLPSAKSAEFIVAKAVRDGVIDATIDHEGGFVQSHDLMDVYATVEPSEAFHRRIAYCLTTHNDAVRGMKYHEDAYKRQLEASRGLKKKGEEKKTDEEKAAEFEDEFDEDY
ncbi:hypothetical protein ACHAWO_002030 [Cyclotella atomus]|uniref:PCI domain-containing protein n=1 Tax=Cyclotella atomus TaxID=382360 RepID=A0ABD3PRJ7_9STRA